MAHSNDTKKLSSILSEKLIQTFRDLEPNQEFVHLISEAISKLVIGDQNEQNEGALQLVEAIQSQDEELVKYLVQSNCSDPNRQLPTGHNPIHLAVQMRGKACAMLLALSSSTKNPLNLNVQNKEGNTAMHIASTLASEDTLSLLLEKNADPNIKNITGNTPLHIACKMNAPKIARRLLQDSRTDVTLKNNEGKAPNQINASPAMQEVLVSSFLARKHAANGRLEIALGWNNYNDLDLHVTCPHGQEIYFGNKKASCCNGTLDIDMNAGGASSEQPVEHVYWERDPSKGKYVVNVRHFAVHTTPEIIATPFYVKISVDKITVWETVKTIYKVKDKECVVSFTYPDDLKLDSSSNLKLVC